LSGTGVEYKPTVTTLGNLDAAVAMAVTIGRLQTRKRYDIRLSRNVAGKMRRDLVLIGGPVKNRISRIFLDCLRAAHPALEIAYHDSGPEDGPATNGAGPAGERSADVDGDKVNLGDPVPYMQLGCQKLDFEAKKQKDDPCYPETDVALAVLWVNPFSDVKRRGLLCAGFTDSGTAAAMSYVLSGTPRARYKEIRRDRRLRQEFGVRRSSRAWPCFVALLQVSLSSDRAISVREVAFAPLPDPKLPLFTPFLEPSAPRHEPAAQVPSALERPVVRSA